MPLQLLRHHNAYQFKVWLHLLPYGHNLKGEFWEFPNLGGWGVRGPGVAPTESPSHNFPIPVNKKILLYLLPFGRNSSVKLWPINSTPLHRLGVWVYLGGWKWYQSKCRPRIPIRLLSIHTIGLSCIVWSQYPTQQTDRESDRNGHQPPIASYMPSATWIYLRPCLTAPRSMFMNLSSQLHSNNVLFKKVLSTENHKIASHKYSERQFRDWWTSDLMN